MKNRRLFEALVKVKNKFDIDRGYVVGLKFMIECLKEIQEECPAIAKKAILSAEKFMAGTINAEVLTAERVACLAFLKKKKSSKLDRRTLFQMQAVICALYPEPPSDDLLEILDWFVEKFSETGNFNDLILIHIKNFFEIDV